MNQRTFKIIDVQCLSCESRGSCQVTNIDRDDVFQSLKDAKLYVFRICSMDDANMLEVKEEL